jgi:hypothetical protein
MSKIYHDGGGWIFIFSALLAFYSLIGCQAPTKPDADMKGIILVVEVKVSDPREESAGTARAGSIIFYSDYSHHIDIADDTLKQRVCSVFGRIIAEGSAQGNDYRTGRPDLSTFRSGVPINDKNFIFALVETAEIRLNSGGPGARVYFTYRNNK